MKIVYFYFFLLGSTLLSASDHSKKDVSLCQRLRRICCCTREQKEIIQPKVKKDRISELYKTPTVPRRIMRKMKYEKNSFYREYANLHSFLWWQDSDYLDAFFLSKAVQNQRKRESIQRKHDKQKKKTKPRKRK